MSNVIALPARERAPLSAEEHAQRLEADLAAKVGRDPGKPARAALEHAGRARVAARRARQDGNENLARIFDQRADDSIAEARWHARWNP